MNRAPRRSGLTIAICALALVFVFLLGLTIFLTTREQPSLLPTEPSESMAESTATTPPTTEATESTTVATTVPAETEPQIQYYTLSFAGDCALADRKGKTSSTTFINVVGDNYAYPFADVQDYFATDDCTFINLEAPLTDGGTPDAKKEFVFKGPTRYVNILTEGSIEFANVVNNHTLDYGEVGYTDTLSTLDKAGIHYAEKDGTVLFTTESGLVVGVYADIDPQNTRGIAEAIKKLRDDGAEVVVVSLHWGYEYYYKHNGTQKKIARYAIDHGADIVYGHHPHVLQEIETYKDGYIFYSLGNFAFGGNGNPPDKDTAIIQMQIVRELDGSVHLGEMTIVPCFVSGAGSYGNDYQPCPMDPTADAEVYERVLKKLNGTYPVKNLYVEYREEPSTETTAPSGNGGSTETTPPSGNGGSTETTPPSSDSGSTETPPPSSDSGSSETPPPSSDSGSSEAPSPADSGSGDSGESTD